MEAVRQHTAVGQELNAVAKTNLKLAYEMLSMAYKLAGDENKSVEYDKSMFPKLAFKSMLERSALESVVVEIEKGAGGFL